MEHGAMKEEGLFEKGLALFEAGNGLAALSFFERACSQQENPVIQSYLAVCIAGERGQISEAVRLCEQAISQEPDNPVIYLNLGRVYLKSGNKLKSLEILRKGMSAGDNVEIRMLLEKIGNRKPPPFPFLDRSNVLNKVAGLILARLKLR